MSFVLVDNHGIAIMYYISVAFVHYEFFRGKVGKGGMNSITNTKT